MKKKALLLFLFVFCGIFAIHAQTRQITGTVTSEGRSVPGVSVVVGGTTIGTVTDFEGQYSLDVPTDAQTLVFSFVGLETQQVPIEGRTQIDVVMEPDFLQVDEVVVTALGITREARSIGYTVQNVSGEDVARVGNPNLMTALSGQAAGMEIRQSSGMPGAPATIFIRGARSFSGDNTPLYVIDGMPVQSQNDYGSNVTGAAFSNRGLDIDPNDIESINVLKGQAAAALYGLRASNGVIIITTKRGQGAAIGRPTVTFSSNTTVDVVARLPEVQQTYAQGFNGALRHSNSFSWGPKIEDLPDHPVYGGNNHGQPDLYYDRYKAEWVEPVAYNNPGEFFSDNGYTYNNNINISSATEFGNYSVGFGSANQTGIIRETGMDRYTGNIAGDFWMSEKWGVGFTGNFTDSKISKLPSGNDSWLFTVYGAPANFDLMGTPSHQPDPPFGEYRQISYRAGAVGNNPNWVLDNNHYREATKRFFGNTYVEYKPVQAVSIKYQIGVDSYTTDNDTFVEMGTGNLPSEGDYPTPDNPVYAYVAPTGGTINKFGITRRIVNSLLTA